MARRAPNITHPKLTVHVVDFRNVPPLPPVDEVYLALGTTIRVAGSQQAFRAVDLDANLAVAKASVAAGARRAALVSAVSADARSRIFYNRLKGELEEALARLPLDAGHRAVNADAVARALLATLPAARGTVILSSSELARLGAASAALA